MTNFLKSPAELKSAKVLAGFFCLLLLMISAQVRADNTVELLPLLLGDTIRTSGIHSTLDMYIENDVAIMGMNLGLKIWSPDGAGWNWLHVGGYGSSGLVTVVPGSRLDPRRSPQLLRTGPGSHDG